MLFEEIKKFKPSIKIVKKGYNDFRILGNLNSESPGLLTFCRDTNPLDIEQAVSKQGVAGIFIREMYADKIKTDATLVLTENPYYDFHLFHQHLYKNSDFFGNKTENIIHPSTFIHKSAVIYDHNIQIGENCDIGANVTIFPNTRVGNNVIIGPGCVIGGESLHIAYDNGKRVFINHAGGVVIGDNSYLGSNNVIIRNVYMDPPTSIGKNVAIANLVMVGHNVRIEDDVQIISNVVLGGGCVIKKGARISFGSCVANYCIVGEDSKVTIGAVVTKNVEPKQKVSGNFAIPHDKLIEHIKNISK